MNRQAASLDSLGRKYGTDKASGGHDYLSFYETFLGGIRDSDVRVLEIGVQFGSSLRMWEEYFSNGTIIGVDIHPGVMTFKGGRIHTEIVDQSNLEDLVQLGVKHGPFDVVVDDGSHIWGHQIDTVKTLLPFLKSPGLFIIEDLHTSYGDLADAFRGASRISAMEYLKKIVDLKVADDQIDLADEDDSFLRTYSRNFDFITFLRRACVIKKNYSRDRHRTYVPGAKAPEMASASLTPAATGDQPVALSLSCHIAGIGDWQSDTGAIRTLNEGEDIQGFIVYGMPGPGFSYRARVADGTWTEWAGCGEFVGTMGASQALSGFSARLSQDAAELFELEFVGLFRGQEDPVHARNGEDCVSDGAPRELCGMQIRLTSFLR